MVGNAEHVGTSVMTNVWVSFEHGVVGAAVVGAGVGAVGPGSAFAVTMATEAVVPWGSVTVNTSGLLGVTVAMAALISA